MAFALSGWARNTSSSNENSVIEYTYLTASDAIATVVASGYFNTVIDRLKVGDRIIIKASDDSEVVDVTSVTTNVTVSSADQSLALADGNIYVGNASGVATGVAMSGDATIANTGALTIAAGAVELGMLATGVSPSHVVKFAAIYNTVGGAAVETISIPGVLATDVVSVTLHTEGGTPRTIVAAESQIDNLAVEFSGDPSNDHFINYVIYRAAV